MILIVGLGNPGKKYQNTRHNLGFMVLDGVLAKLLPVEKTAWKENKKFNSEIAKIGNLILAKPQTFMNASGLAVTKITNYYKIKPEDIWVVHDDVDLLLGKMRVRKGGSSAGHRGLESIIEELGKSDFVRFRLGIGYPVKKEKAKIGKEKLVERYVLSEFKREEKTKVKQVIGRAVKAIKIALVEDWQGAANQFN